MASSRTGLYRPAPFPQWIGGRGQSTDYNPPAMDTAVEEAQVAARPQQRQLPGLAGLRAAAGRFLASSLAHVLGLYVVSRLLVAAAVAGVVKLNGLIKLDGLGGLPLPKDGFNGPWPPVAPGNHFVRALGTWDAAWLMQIERVGYFRPFLGGAPGGPIPIPQQGIRDTPYHVAQEAFFPGLPLIVRGVAAVTGLSPLDAGVLTVFLLGAVASAAVWYVARELLGEDTAFRATALWLFFPGSLVLTLVYAEGLTIVGSAFCLLFLLRRNWWLAGVAGAVATFSQPVAVAVIACCAWAAGVEIYRRRERGALVALVAPVLSSFGILAYMLYLYAKTGDILRWYRVEVYAWNSGNGWRQNTVDILSGTFRHPSFVQTSILGAFLLLALVGLVLMVFWRPPAIIWVYTVGVVVLALDSTPVGVRGRVVLVAFPLIVALGRVLRDRAAIVLAGVFGVFLTLLTFMTLGLSFLPP